MRFVLALAVAYLSVSGLSLAADLQGSSVQATDIPAQELDSALQMLAKERGFQVVFVAKELKGLRTEGARGELTAQEALERLLQGTGFTFRLLGADGVSIVSVGDRKQVAGESKGVGVREAQGDEAGANTGISGEEKVELSEIVVTAQRKEESINKVPISMMALSQKTMDDLHIESVADLVTFVPGVVLSPASAQPDASNIAIRGITSGFNAPTTQLYIDETPIAIRQLTSANSKSPYPNIFDLDRVEVLRGPQGTLFGTSAMGGAIRFITPQPNLNSSSGSAKAEFGYTDGGDPSYEVGGAYGAPVVAGKAGFRVSGWYQSLGGFIDREDPYTGSLLARNANAVNAYVVRPALTWAPSEALTATLSAFIQHQHSQNGNTYWIDYLPAPQSNGHHAWGGLAQPMTDDLRVGSLSIKYNFAGLSFVSDTSYLSRASRTIEDTSQIYEGAFTGQVVVPSLQSSLITEDNRSSTVAWQQEFRLSSQDPTSRINWVAGAFYRHAAQRLAQLEPPDASPLFEYCCGVDSLTATGVPNYIYGGEVLNGYSVFHATDVSEALFGDMTVNLHERLKLNLGARVERAEVKGQDQFLAGPLDVVTPGVASTFTVLPDTVANPVTPRASLTYQMTDDEMVYASAAKGYRAGGSNIDLNNNLTCQQQLPLLGLSSIPSKFSSDSLWSYEAGTKDWLFNRRLSIEGSVYYVKWSGIQTQLACGGYPFTLNQGEAISRGFDLQIAAAVTHDLKVGALVGYTDAYHPNASYGPQASDGSRPLLAAAGDKILGVLPWQAAMNAEYSRSVDSLWSNARAYLRADYRWLGAATSQNPNTVAYFPNVSPYTDPAYSILNLRLGVSHGGLDLSAYINNATNSDPRLGFNSFEASIDTPLFYAGAIRPRTVGVTAWYRY